MANNLSLNQNNFVAIKKLDYFHILTGSYLKRLDKQFKLNDLRIATSIGELLLRGYRFDRKTLQALEFTPWQTHGKMELRKLFSNGVIVRMASENFPQEDLDLFNQAVRSDPSCQIFIWQEEKIISNTPDPKNPPKIKGVVLEGANQLFDDFKRYALGDKSINPDDLVRRQIEMEKELKTSLAAIGRYSPIENLKITPITIKTLSTKEVSFLGKNHLVPIEKIEEETIRLDHTNELISIKAIQRWGFRFSQKALEMIFSSNSLSPALDELLSLIYNFKSTSFPPEGKLKQKEEIYEHLFALNESILKDTPIMLTEATFVMAEEINYSHQDIETVMKDQIGDIPIDYVDISKTEDEETFQSILQTNYQKLSFLVDVENGKPAIGDWFNRYLLQNQPVLLEAEFKRENKDPWALYKVFMEDFGHTEEINKYNLTQISDISHLMHSFNLFIENAPRFVNLIGKTGKYQFSSYPKPLTKMFIRLSHSDLSGVMDKNMNRRVNRQLFELIYPEKCPTHNPNDYAFFTQQLTTNQEIKYHLLSRKPFSPQIIKRLNQGLSLPILSPEGTNKLYLSDDIEANRLNH